MANITKKEYTMWRGVLRNNGRSALRWMPGHVRVVFDRLEAICGVLDVIADRVYVLDLFRAAGLPVTYRHTAPHHLLQKIRLSYR